MAHAGAVAAGHPATAAAAEAILREGGTAFDAVVAGAFAACVAEPVLCSLGGGGFCLAAPAGRRPQLYDFFVQTPRTAAPGPVDFRPVLADFGPARQEFHIGLAAAATPGMVRGLFGLHRALGRLPRRELLAPAIRMAREGLVLEPLQAYIFGVVGPIYLATPEARRLFGDPERPGSMLAAGARLRQPEQAAALEALAFEGEDLFYRGEIAAGIERLCREGGGHLRRDDLAAYRLERRAPLECGYRGARIFLNPPPAAGGILIALALHLLEHAASAAHAFGSLPQLRLLAEAMTLTAEARLDASLRRGRLPERLERFDPQLMARYRARILGRARAARGTTHLSVLDGRGNVAALSMSNGEGCGHLVPGTGIMLNNMLGEADLNPAGWHRWRPDERMSSMMCPTLMASAEGTQAAMGSGGSNRLRSAILQVLLNLLDHGMTLEAAVSSPRIHVEEGLLSAESGFDPDTLQRLCAEFPRHALWPAPNLFFGGVHAVSRGRRGLAGAGDPRRGGVARILGGPPEL